VSDLAILPTRKAEDWRYADLDALARLWPLPAPERVDVAAGESFSRTIVIDAGGVTRLALHLGRHARATVHVLNLGGAYARADLTVTLDEGADFTLGGVQLAGEDETHEIVATVIHVGADSASRQVVRSVLGTRATGTVLGKIRVDKGADGTDAAQSVRAMLLTRTATANARPELEIHADDVKCAHGCAVGELDAMGLFYLQSRGLSPEQAKALMLRAFIAEGLAGAADEDRLSALAMARLEALL
jgi:Fe-S cluster assembly protein SufD